MAPPRDSRASLLIALLAALPLLPTLWNGFVYDDQVLLRGPAPALGEALTGDLFGDDDAGRPASGYWRPLVRLTYLAESWIWGGRAAGWHFDNLLLHAAVAVLLFRLLRRLAGCREAAFPAAAFFAVLPVHAESVALITGRTDPLAFLFFLGAAHAAAGRRTFAALGWFAAALACKESIVALLPMLALVPWGAGAAEGGRPGRAAGVLFTGGAVLFAAFLAVKVGVLGIVPPPDAWTGAGGAAERLLTAVAVLPDQLRLVFWPADLSIVHDAPLVAGPLEPRFLLGTLAALALAGLFALGDRAARIGVATFFLALAPASNVVPITYAFVEMPFPLFERYLFVPSAGLALLVGTAVARLARRADARAAGRTAALASLALALPYGARFAVRCLDFQSDATLFEAAARGFPRPERLLLHAAGARYLAGDPWGALRAYDDVLERAPDLLQAHVERAGVLADLAQRHFSAAAQLETAESRAEARRHGEGLLTRARDAVDDALRKNPDDPGALEVAGQVAGLSGDLETAAFHLRRALGAGRPTVARNLRYVAEQLQARCRASAARGHEAALATLALQERALRALTGGVPPREIPPPIAGLVVQLYAEYADHLVLTGQDEAAADAYHRLLDLDPRLYRALEGLAYLAKQRGDRALAYRFLEDALRIEPDAFYALTERTTMLQEDGRTEEASRSLQRLQDLFGREGVPAARFPPVERP